MIFFFNEKIFDFSIENAYVNSKKSYNFYLFIIKNINVEIMVPYKMLKTMKAEDFL